MKVSNITRAVDHHLIMTSITPYPKTQQAKKPKKPVKVKVKKLDPDYWFSLCVRQRDGWTCTNCGKHYEPTINSDTGLPGTRALHCSHYIGRANYATRFDPLDVDAHCYGCHSKFEGNPHLFQRWKVEQLGIEKYEILIEKSCNILLGKQARQEKQEIARHYQSEFYKMVNTGINEFVGYF